jgi:hypothetical protein
MRKRIIISFLSSFLFSRSCINQTYSIALRLASSGAYFIRISEILNNAVNKYIINITPTGAIRLIQISCAASRAAFLLKSGTSRGDFVLLYITAQRNQISIISSISSVHLECLGNSIESTHNRLKRGFPYYT